MDFKIEEVPELKGFTVEWSEKGNYFLSRKNVIYRSADLTPPFTKFAVVEAPFWKRLAANFRLAQRLLRFQVTNIIPLGNGDVFVSFDKSVGIIRNGEYINLKGLIRPCRVLRSACAADEKGNIFFGEYLANDERGEMRIYRYRTGGDSVEVVYTFAPNSIKHVHGIYFDEFTKSLFCLTGDDLHECRILQTTDEFQNVTDVGQGDETWRAVSLLFTESHLFYGMDAEFRTNHIFQFERKSCERKSLGEVSGTVFYSKKIGDDLFFTTTAEDAPSQKENVAAIWQVTKDGVLQELIKFQKDSWHPSLFQFGTIHFPNFKRLEDELYFYLISVENDNRTFRISKN